MVWYLEARHTKITPELDASPGTLVRHYTRTLNVCRRTAFASPLHTSLRTHSIRKTGTRPNRMWQLRRVVHLLEKRSGIARRISAGSNNGSNSTRWWWSTKELVSCTLQWATRETVLWYVKSEPGQDDRHCTLCYERKQTDQQAQIMNWYTTLTKHKPHSKVTGHSRAFCCQWIAWEGSSIPCNIAWSIWERRVRTRRNKARRLLYRGQAWRSLAYSQFWYNQEIRHHVIPKWLRHATLHS